MAGRLSVPSRCLLATLVLLVSTGCSSAPRFPVDHLIEYDSKNKVCGLYQIVSFDTFQAQYVGDIPCPDVFGFNSGDIPKVLNWMRDTKKYVGEHCK
jgi:hypothetical protein